MSLSEHELDALTDEYNRMKERKRHVRNEVRERYREVIENAVEREAEAIEREFAIEFVSARDRGATRSQLVKVIRTGSADTFRKYVELGGGVIRGRETGADRARERGAELGVIPKGTNLFELYKSVEGIPMEPIEIHLVKEGDTHMMLPSDMDNLVKMRDAFGYSRKDNIILANQIAEAFGVKLGETQ